MRVDEQQFRAACSRFPTGVTVATVLLDNGAPRGLTVGSFTSVSLDPPLILICIHRESHLLPFFHCGNFGINVLAESQVELSSRFSLRESRHFHSIAWRRGATGAPLIEGSLAFFECALRQAVSSGDHEILIGEVAALSICDGEPLVRYASSYRALHEPGSSAASGARSLNKY